MWKTFVTNDISFGRDWEISAVYNWTILKTIIELLRMLQNKQLWIRTQISCIRIIKIERVNLMWEHWNWSSLKHDILSFIFGKSCTDGWLQEQLLLTINVCNPTFKNWCCHIKLNLITLNDMLWVLSLVNYGWPSILYYNHNCFSFIGLKYTSLCLFMILLVEVIFQILCMLVVSAKRVNNFSPLHRLKYNAKKNPTNIYA